MPNLKEFLDHIAQIESNKGQNTNHPVIQHGMHRGMHAIGQYGLMPLTAQELAKNSQDPNIALLAHSSPDQLTQQLQQHPEIQQKLAEQLAQQVLQRQHGDPLRAAYAWNQGHNLSPDQIPQEKLDASPYVQKYQKLDPGMNPDKDPATIQRDIQSAKSMPPYTKEKAMDEQPSAEALKAFLEDYQEEPDQEIDTRKPLEDEDDDKMAQMQALQKFLA